MRRKPNRRRYTYSSSYDASKNKLFRNIYGLMMVFMFVAVLSLGYMINEKQQFVDLTVFKETVVEKLNLKSLSTWIPFEKWFQKDAAVSSTIQYNLIEGNRYTNGTNQAKAVYDGIVLLITPEQDKFSVLVKQDNGVLTTYSELTESQVKVNDRILIGTTIGNYDASLLLSFTKDGKSIEYANAIVNSED